MFPIRSVFKLDTSTNIYHSKSLSSEMPFQFQCLEDRSTNFDRTWQDCFFDIKWRMFVILKVRSEFLPLPDIPLTEMICKPHNSKLECVADCVFWL